VPTDWDERYLEPGFVYGTDPNEFLVSVVHRIPHGKILSLAEGEGRNAVYLASLGYQVTGVDGSEVGLRKAVELARERGVSITTIHADLGEFEIEPEQWDGVIACYCHLPSDIRIPLHRAAVRGLKTRRHLCAGGLQQGAACLQHRRPPVTRYAHVPGRADAGTCRTGIRSCGQN